MNATLYIEVGAAVGYGCSKMVEDAPMFMIVNRLFGLAFPISIPANALMHIPVARCHLELIHHNFINV